MQTSVISERSTAVWCVHANAPGPQMGFIGGVHGNEAAGIAVITRLVEAFKTGKLILTRGTLTLALGNLEAIAANARSTAPERDLNRCFGPRVMRETGTSSEARRAHELARALQRLQIGVDLHATNLPSTPFLVAQSLTGRHAETVTSFLGARILLTDPHWIFGGGPSTLDEFLNRGRRTGICYETGFADDLSRVEEVETELLDLLRHFGMVAGAPRTLFREPKERYELVQAIIPTCDGFTFVREHDLRNFRPVSADEHLGNDGSLPIIAEHEGVLVFPKAKHLRMPRKPVCYLARRI